MACRWFSTAVDARDHARLARWWAEVLDYRVVVEDRDFTFIADRSYPDINLEDGRRFALGTQPYPGLLFMRRTPNICASNRLRIDINPDDQDAEVERLVDMGARCVETNKPNGRRIMLADPEGNEFCVMPPMPLPVTDYRPSR